MRLTIGQLKKLVTEALISEFGNPSGSLRRVRGGSPNSRKVKLGKIEEENKELSSFEAEERFPGATDAWAEIVPELFPDFPWDDAAVIKKKTLWFKLGNELRVAFDDMPQIELASWDPTREDWIELDHAA